MTEALEQLVHRVRLKGYREGFIKGFIEGYMETTEKIVRKMTEAGYSFDLISNLTGASEDEIRKIVGHIATSSQTQQS